MPDLSFLVDANMPRSSKEVLEKEGYSVEDVREIGLGSASDDRIVADALEEDRVVLTRDTDVGSVLRHSEHPGAVILRLPHRFTARDLNERLSRVLFQVQDGLLSGAVVVVELDRFRRRPIE
jgi:predicted nuclease of predicted toxin-antitoxin system